MKKIFNDGEVDFKMSFTTRCPARCTTCLNPTITEHYDLEWDVFKKYIEEIIQLDIPNKKRVSFYNIGEVYSHPHFVEWCEWAIPLLHEKGIFTDVVTNGFNITAIPKGIDSFEISFNAGKKETFENITKISFDSVYHNIISLYDKGEFKKAKRVIIRMLCFDENANEENDFKNLFKHLKGVRYRFNYLYDNQFGETKHHGLVERIERVPCSYITNKVNLYPSGDLNICCHDFKKTVVLGNLKSNSLLEILQGDARMHLFNQHNELVFSGLCEKCNFNSSRTSEYVKHGYFYPPYDIAYQMARKIYSFVFRK